MSDIRYRSEIDGLRAIAVLGVVLFHFGLGLPGGFVGVDVFFVISGFLITSIIKRQIEAGSFSMTDFGVRRIKRILPAVTAMVLVSLLAGYYLLTTEAFHSLAKSSIAQSLMSANIFFWRDTGYFAEAADYKPLLHTWSLSVEEQFYVILPAVIILLKKWLPKRIYVILFLSCIFSLTLSCYGLHRSASATFYLLPTRAWELLAGSLLAYSNFHKHWNSRIAETTSAIGLFMILICFFLYDKETLFPGYNAIIPVLGSTLFIAGNHKSLTLSGRLLSLKPFVWIGLLSYSFYLWHWPLYVYTKHIVLDINLSWKIGLFSSSLLAGYLSWRFIETPFRSRNFLNSQKQVISFGVITSLLSLSIALIIWKVQPSSQLEKNPAHKLLIEDIEWSGLDYKSKDTPISLGTSALNESHPIFAIWGDSHAMASAGTIDKVATNNNLSGIMFSTGGTAPVTETFRNSEIPKKEVILNEKLNILNAIINSNISDLIIIARWELYTSGYSDSDLSHSEMGKDKYAAVLSEGTYINSPKKASEILSKNLISMCQTLREHGIRVWILKQIPECNIPYPAKAYYLSIKYPKLNSFPLAQVYKSTDRQHYASLPLDSLPPNIATVIDPTKYCLSDEGSIILHNNSRCFYRDSNHLTRAGADRFLTPIFEHIFSSIESQ